MIFPDLINANFAASYLLGGGVALSTGQLAVLPSKITAASSMVASWCNDRFFPRATYTEVCVPNQDGRITLRQLPVNQVLRASRGREDAISIGANPALCQIADISFSMTGDWAAGQVVTGLALSSTIAGTSNISSIIFSSLSPPTVQSLTNAINTIGSPWSAAASSPYGPWPVSELVGGEAAKGALQGAALQAYGTDCQVLRLERATGELWTDSARDLGGDGFGPRWGPDWGLWSDGRTSPGPVRVRYDAGFDAIPMQVQEATAMVVGWLYNNSSRDLMLSSESVGSYSYVVNTAFASPDFPKEVIAYLARYRIWRV